jgi:DNA (cytosine-5)-methyltransferase 1
MNSTNHQNSTHPILELYHVGSSTSFKVLNLYAGIGGNRKLWENCEVTAVEMNEEIAGIYKEYYPNDNVIVGDAHEYLLNNYDKFDFIWSSPPCQTHSRATFWGGSRGKNRHPKYIDFKLWQEIIFLKHYSKCKFVVENVVPYYEPFVQPTVILQRHCFWSNFKIVNFALKEPEFNLLNVSANDTVYGISLKGRKMKHRKDAILRNMVNPDLGLYIFEQAQGLIRQSNDNQLTLFGSD